MSKKSDLEDIKAKILLNILVESQRLINAVGSSKLMLLTLSNQKNMTIAHMARILWAPRQSIQKVANKLVAENLCVYEINYHHKTSKIIKLTQKGRDFLEKEKKSFYLEKRKINTLATTVDTLQSLGRW